MNKRNRRYLKTSLVCLVFVFLSAAFYFIMPFSKIGRETVIDSTSSTDGSFFVLVQKYGGLERLYDVSFYVKRGSNQWRGYYVDHDSFYWHSGRVSFDKAKNKALVWHGSTLVATFDMKSGSFFHVVKSHPIPWNKAEITSAPFFTQ